jgi:molecular chaperone HscB
VSSLFPEYFALFGIAPRFGIDPEHLTRAYREVLSQVHPDRFAGAGPAERRAAMQLASHANEAYEVLRADSARAAYLCRQQGMVIDGAGAVPLPPAFLERQMLWHEQLDEARTARDGAAIAALMRDVAEHRESTLRQIALCLDERQDYPAAAAAVRALMFLEKLGGDIARVAAERNDASASEKE